MVKPSVMMIIGLLLIAGYCSVSGHATLRKSLQRGVPDQVLRQNKNIF
jgi:hypothetical protein